LKDRLRCILIVGFAFLAGCPCDDYHALPVGQGYGILGDSIMAAGSDDCSSVGSLLSISLGEKVLDLAKDSAKMDYIAAQYPALKEQRPYLHTVISNGGVNDIVSGEEAEVVAGEILDLFEAVVADEKQLIFLLQYRMLGSKGDEFNPVIDAVDDQLLLVCDQVGVACLDMRNAFEGHPEYYFDHVHPVLEGRQVLTYEIFNNL
jgi:hypothetical protein